MTPEQLDALETSYLADGQVWVNFTGQKLYWRVLWSDLRYRLAHREERRNRKATHIVMDDASGSGFDLWSMFEGEDIEEYLLERGGIVVAEWVGDDWVLSEPPKPGEPEVRSQCS